MAVLSRVSAPPGYGILTGAPAEKPRRFVSDGHGGGAWLTTTETEDEAANAALQAERAAREAANLALFSPTANAAASARREAAVAEKFSRDWPRGPRQHLREAHGELSAAEAELPRCREHADASAVHLASSEAEAACAQKAVTEIRQQAAAELRGRLSGAGILVAGYPDAAETAAMATAERSRRTLAVAIVAEGEIAASVRAAEAAVVTAKRGVETAALAAIEEARHACQAELTAAEAVVEGLRKRWAGLHVDSRYGSANWPAPLKALLENPEAEI